MLKRAEVELEILELMHDSPETVLLSVDMNLKLLNLIRSLNVGIREQTMIGLAAGLSRSGLTPICYGIGCQVVLRAAEQIRFAVENDASMVIVGIGHNGYYADDGMSHNSDVVFDFLAALQVSVVESVSEAYRRGGVCYVPSE